MKTNLKTFPSELQSLNNPKAYIAQTWIWKIAFEKELKEYRKKGDHITITEVLGE